MNLAKIAEIGIICSSSCSHAGYNHSPNQSEAESQSAGQSAKKAQRDTNETELEEYFSNDTKSHGNEPKEAKQIEGAIAELKQSIDGLETAVKARDEAACERQQYSDPNFTALDNVRDALAAKFEEIARQIAFYDASELRTLLRAISAVVTPDKSNAGSIQDETYEIERLSRSLAEAHARLTAMLRICHLATCEENSLFARVRKMAHPAIIDAQEMHDLLNSSIGNAAKFAPEIAEDMVSSTISLIVKTQIEKQPDVPSFFLIKATSILRARLAQCRDKLDPVKREILRRLNLLGNYLEQLADELKHEATSSNTPDNVRPLIETNKKIILDLSLILKDQTKEIADRTNSICHSSEKILGILTSAEKIKWSTEVLDRISK